jgi:hypothetical protein
LSKSLCEPIQTTVSKSQPRKIEKFFTLPSGGLEKLLKLRARLGVPNHLLPKVISELGEQETGKIHHLGTLLLGKRLAELDDFGSGSAHKSKLEGDVSSVNADSDIGRLLG